MCRRASLLALVLAACPARADFLYGEVLETLMESSADTALILNHLYGPDPSAKLKFSTALDPYAKTFSYSTLPGQTYLGLPVSLSTVGTYDAVAGQFNWTVNGSVGAAPVTGTGSLFWVGDPVGHDTAKIKIDGKEYTVTSVLDVQLETVTRFKSTGTYTFTGPPNGPFGPGPFGPYSGTDSNIGQTYTHEVQVPKTPLTPDGSVIFMSGFSAVNDVPGQPLTVGPGTFDLTITPVPAPGGLVLAGVAVAALAVRRRVG